MKKNWKEKLYPNKLKRYKVSKDGKSIIDTKTGEYAPFESADDIADYVLYLNSETIGRDMIEIWEKIKGAIS